MDDFTKVALTLAALAFIAGVLVLYFVAGKEVEKMKKENTLND